MKITKLLALIALAFSMQSCLFEDDEESADSSSSLNSSSSLSSSTDLSSSVKETSSSSSSSNSSSTTSSSSVASSSSTVESSSVESSSSVALSANPLIWIASDYTTGSLHSLNQDLSQTELSLNVSQDALVFQIADGKAVVIERTDADNVLLYDLVGDSVIYQKALTAGANAYDVAQLPNGNLLIPYFNTGDVVEIDLSTGNVVKEVNLNAYQTANAFSACPNEVLVYNGRLFVSLQRLDNGFKADQAFLVELNAADLSVLDTFQLNGFNPYALEIVEGDLFIAHKGNTEYDANWNEISLNDGMLELVNLDTKAKEIVATEAELGAKPVDMVFTGTDFYLSLYYSFGSQSVLKLNSTTDEFETIAGITDASGGLSYSASHNLLFIGDRDFLNPGLYSYDGQNLKSISVNSLAPYSVSAD